MPQLEFSTYISQIFWLIIAMLPLFFVVKAYFLPRAESIVTLRKNKVIDDLKAAQNAIDEQKSLKVQMSIVINEAKDSALAIRHNAMRDSSQYINGQLSKLDEELAGQINKQLDKLTRSRIVGSANMKESADELAENVLDVISTSFELKNTKLN